MPIDEAPAMRPERHVRLFRNGRNQALRIPREFELPGNAAMIYKETNNLREFSRVPGLRVENWLS